MMKRGVSGKTREGGGAIDDEVSGVMICYGRKRTIEWWA